MLQLNKIVLLIKALKN